MFFAKVSRVLHSSDWSDRNKVSCFCCVVPPPSPLSPTHLPPPPLSLTHTHLIGTHNSSPRVPYSGLCLKQPSMPCSQAVNFCVVAVPWLCNSGMPCLVLACTLHHNRVHYTLWLKLCIHRSHHLRCVRVLLSLLHTCRVARCCAFVRTVVHVWCYVSFSSHTHTHNTQ